MRGDAGYYIAVNSGFVSRILGTYMAAATRSTDRDLIASCFLNQFVL